MAREQLNDIEDYEEEYPEGEEPDQDTQLSDAIAQLTNRANKSEADNINLQKAIGSFQEEKKDANFLHLEIATEYLLQRLEHFYKSDIMKEENGNVFWKEQENKELVTFNEFGVNALMEIVTKYIDKNTILSSYTDERINEILADIGDELTLFILCNYVKIGMDTYYKKTKFRLIIVTTLHLIESTYRRALRGKTLEELNQSKVVGQFNQDNRPLIMPKQKPQGMARYFG